MISAIAWAASGIASRGEEWKKLQISIQEPVELRVVDHDPAIEFSWNGPSNEADGSALPWTKAHRSGYYPLHFPAMTLDEYLELFYWRDDEERKFAENAYRTVPKHFRNGSFDPILPRWSYLFREMYVKYRGREFVICYFMFPGAQRDVTWKDAIEGMKAGKCSTSTFEKATGMWKRGSKGFGPSYIDSQAGWEFDFNFITESIANGQLIFGDKKRVSSQP